MKLTVTCNRFVNAFHDLGRAEPKFDPEDIDLIFRAQSQKIANRIARQNGYGRADDIVIIEGQEPKILKRIDYGYRKWTTGEYVPNAYRNNFGWKNTYYQNAYTAVGIPKHMIQKFPLDLGTAPAGDALGKEAL